MKLKSGSIEVGKCYETKRGELRKVVSIQPSGEVTFDTRKKSADGGWSQPRRFHEKVENFTREAVSEVPCPT